MFDFRCGPLYDRQRKRKATHSLARKTLTPERAGIALFLYLACASLAAGLVSRIAGAFPALAGLGLLDSLQLLLAFLPPVLFLLRARPRRRGAGGGLRAYAYLLLFLGPVVGVNVLNQALLGAAELLWQLPAPAALSLPASGGGRLALFVNSCLLTPLLEELFFRGGVQAALGEWGTAPAVGISSLLFTMAHGGLRDLLPVLLLSLLLGWAAAASRSLLPSILMHAANNSLAYLAALAPELWPGGGSTAMWVLCALLAGVSLWFWRRLRRRGLLRQAVRLLAGKKGLGRALASSPMLLLGGTAMLAAWAGRLLLP